MSTSLRIHHNPRHGETDHLPPRCKRVLSAAFLLLVAVLLVPPQQARAQTPDPVIFTTVPMSAPALTNPSGVVVSSSFATSASFRVTSPTRITALGSWLEVSGTPTPVYAALYKLDTSDSYPDIPGDGNLLASTLLTPVGTGGNVSGDIAVTVQPGWYAIAIGRGRNGAPASGGFVSAPDFTTSNSYQGVYNVRVSTGERILMASSPRLFVRGHDVSLPPDNIDFLQRTATRFARWSHGSYTINSGNHFASRFHITHTVTVEHVSAWLRNGSGAVFAAIVHLPSATARPQPYGSTAFAQSLVGTTLIQVGQRAGDYRGDFAGLTLTPGEYALIIGTGRFGAGGYSHIMLIDDHVLIPDALIWQDTSDWWDLTGQVAYNITLRGDFPQLAITPSAVAFPVTALNAQHSVSLTLSNQGDFPVQLGGSSITGRDPAAFLVDDPNGCFTMLLPAGNDCALSATYQPQSAASHKAVLRVSSNGRPQPLTVDLGGSSIGLAVGIDDATGYAAYGKPLSYTVTVTNNGTTTASDIELAVTQPAQFDWSQASWSCTVTGGSGCTASGTGPLADSGLTLASSASVSYELQVPVKDDASGTTATLGAAAATTTIGPFSDTDRDTLVIFRNGFD